MRDRWGLPYMGSKNQICDFICNNLPKGNRLVDLFGGGGAITMYGMYTYKWKEFYYNDINPIPVNAMKDTLNHRWTTFKPFWVSREMYNDEKEKPLNEIDPYIMLCWSFGNKLIGGYLYSEDIEEWKHAYWNAVMEFDFTLFHKLGIKFDCEIPQYDLFGNRQSIRRPLAHEIRRKIDEIHKLGYNAQCGHLESLQRLERLERLQRLEIHNIDYREYEYKDGDIVYCDIPYENTAKYEGDGGFDQQAFVEWAMSRPYQVFISSTDKYSYKDRWKVVATTYKNSLLNGKGSDGKRLEVLYVNR